MNTEEDYAIKASKTSDCIYNPPYIPSANPTGCYREWFTVPEEFTGRDVFLTFDGVETVYYLWINGQPVGYSQDSKLPSEFNITKYIKEGKNLMAVMVIRFTESSYVEDQDYWHISGIYRSVWLNAKPALRIDDYKITALPDLHTGVGNISVDATISRVRHYADCTVRVAVYDLNKRKAAEDVGNVMATAEYRTDLNPTANTARVKLEINDAKLWSPENPVLYTAVITLLGPDGDVLDIESCKIGFKLIEVENGIVKLNGKRLIIHGVNRHEHYFKTGRTVTREHMLEEIKALKRMNMNAVRTSHYPDMPEWYELCDEYGILLVCECNVETHGLGGMLTHNPAWSGVFLDRAVRMVQNYKNHVSIFSWSLGNESGTGANHAAMYGFIKEYDPHRLCQYEAGNPGKNISDIRGSMYAPIDDIVKMLCDPVDNRPIILVEYLYQIRNSGGGMEHFIKLTEDYPRFQGGFTWDWQDKCLCGKTDDGTEYFAYGGDFGESVVEDGSPPSGCPPFMTNNGLVLPDLTWKPIAYEVKQAYCPVRISAPKLYGWHLESASADDEFVFKQIFDTVPFRIVAILRENGITIAEEPVPQPQSGKFTFSIPHEKKPGSIYTIEFSVRQCGDTFYADDGFELGLYQFPLKSIANAPFVAACKSDSSKLSIDFCENDDIYSVSAGEIKVEFDKSTGELKSYSKRDRVFIQGGGLPLFNRPYTGLDAYKNWGWLNEYAKIRDISLGISGTRVFSNADAVCIEFEFAAMSEVLYDISCSVRYTISGAGKIGVEFSAYIDPSYKVIPRVGLEFIIPQCFERLEYFGLGPVENYCDRKLNAYLAVHESTVAKQHFAFVPPSECGGHDETRRVTLSSDADASLSFCSKTPFHFDVHHSTVQDYIMATHDHKLIRRPESYLHIDAMHGPIGSDMAWSTVLPAAYQVNKGSYYLSFEICI
jgi:beta-galactosidase